MNAAMEKASETGRGMRDRDRSESSLGEDSNFSATAQIKRATFEGRAPAARRASFEVISFDEKNEVIELGESELIVGRGPECDVRLSVENVSRRHARVLFRNEEYHIEDLNSTNGLYVNGGRVEKCILRDTDQIEIGGGKILFRE